MSCSLLRGAFGPPFFAKVLKFSPISIVVANLSPEATLGTKPKRFKELDILGKPYTFTWDTDSMPDDSKTDFGETIDGYQRVAINAELIEEKSTDLMLEVTVLHEICHAVMDASGQKEVLGNKEEGVVKALEGLHPIICKLVKLGYFKS